MKETIVILLGHKKRVGKDTIAAHLHRNYNYTILPFARKLKEIVQDLYEFSDEQMSDELKEIEDKRYINYIDQEYSDSYNIKNPDYKEYFTPRRILQIFGQQQREIFKDIWAKYVFDQIAFCSGQNYVIPDFRFRNEFKVAFDWLTGNNNTKLITVKINRPIDNHSLDSSENDLNDFDHWNYIIENDSTEQSLLNKFDELVMSNI